MDLTIGDIVLHPSSWIDLQFSGLRKGSELAEDISKRHIRPRAIRTGINESGAEKLGSATHSTEPIIVFSWIVTLSVALGIVYVFRL